MVIMRLIALTALFTTQCRVGFQGRAAAASSVINVSRKPNGEGLTSIIARQKEIVMNRKPARQRTGMSSDRP